MLSYTGYEPIVFPATVLEEWDLDAAVNTTYPGNLLPSRVARSAATYGSNGLADIIAAKASFGYRSLPAEIVRVPKLDKTTRPAADLPFEDEVLYGALVSIVRQAIPSAFVDFTLDGEHDYAAFERYPLTLDDTAYVVEADVAAFYQYIDHERLAYELIGLTGRDDVAEPLIRSIEGWMATPRGIPQGPTPSYVLADIYIAPAARALARAGFSFSRYSDDFRIAGRSWPEVKRAQEVLEASLYALGLVVAPKKLRGLKVETYRKYVERANDPRLQRATIREALDELEAEDYVPTAREPRRDVSTDEVRRAHEVFVDQSDADRVDNLSTRLIRRTLPILGSGVDPVVLPRLTRLMSRYAHLTQVTSTYLRFLMGTNEEGAAVNSIEQWLDGSTYRLPWQVGWILNAACFAQQPHSTLAEGALHVFASDRYPWFARGQAAICLAIHGRLPAVETFVDTYERAPTATRPDLVAAVVIDDPPWRESFVSGASDNPILRTVAALDQRNYMEWL